MPASPHALRGLYAITDANLQKPEQLADRVLQAVEGGARLIQYRDKSPESLLRLKQALALCELCRRHDVLFIVNDDIALAHESGAHGVHLGRDDPGLRSARQRLGDNAIIGASCYNRLELAQRAAEGGADYIAFGRFFASRTKPAAVQAGLDLIRQAKQQLRLPVAAIGGITPANAALLIDAGADMLAVVQGVFAAPDIRRAAAEYAALFRKQIHETV